jgi:hypothetical protein
MELALMKEALAKNSCMSKLATVAKATSCATIKASI